MAFWGDLASALSMASPTTFLLKDAIDRTGLPANQTSPDRTHTFIPRNSSNKGVADLINPIYGGQGDTSYSQVFDKAYENLGQPAHDTNRQDVYTAGTRALASSFADRIYQKTGYLPTEDQVRQFVAGNLTPAFAQKFILGLAPDQITSMADEYIAGNPDTLVNPENQGAQKSAEEQRLSGIKDQLDKVYDTGKTSLVSNYDQEVYGPGKKGVANDLAGQGMITNPNSRISLDQIESNRGRDIAGGLNQLEGQRAVGNIDLSKTIEDLLQRDKDRNLSASQFNKTFNANRDDTFFNQGLQNRQLGIADQLGKLQAGSNKKDWTDYLNTGLNVAATGAKVAALF